MAMEFVAATKEGLVVYDAAQVEEGDDSGNWFTGRCSNGMSCKVVAKMPSPPNAFGFCWSEDGTLIASACDEGVRIYDATDGYKMLREIEKVAPDVQGRAGGVRSIRLSPKNNFCVTYEKWDPQFPENVHVWDLRAGKENKRLYSCSCCFCCQSCCSCSICCCSKLLLPLRRSRPLLKGRRSILLPCLSLQLRSPFVAHKQVANCTGRRRSTETTPCTSLSAG